MTLNSLYLQNFRCYEEGYFEFCPHLNLIYGPNARGKTSVLEAIHLLMIGRSFRSTQNSDLIKKDSSEYFVESHFTKLGIEQKLKIISTAKERKIIFNSTNIVNLSNLLGLIPGVLQTPDDINLIKGSPQLRRQFLDIQITQIDPLYVHYLTRYNRAMRQRNQLLRSKNLISIEPWEYEMSHAAAYITQKRAYTIENLHRTCQEFYANLTGETTSLTLKYKTQAGDLVNLVDLESIKQYFQRQYKKNREREKILGFTLSGPHKDDFIISINNQDARFFASEGQQRSCIIALHFAEWQNLYALTNEKPIFMIDDVSMSLDKNRLERLLQQLFNLGQVFLTTTDQSLFDYYPGTKKAFSL